LKFIRFIIYISIISFTKVLIAQTIAVINVQFLIDNNYKYNDVITKMEISQKKYLESFAKKEKDLDNIFEELEQSKLILNENEINNQIKKYNQELTNFTLLVEEFNLHYQNQIINIREIILKEIFILLEKYAINNKIDLVLDSTTYLIASNSIDITQNINDELLKTNFKLEYNDFETN